MPYRFKKNESVPEGIRRIVLEEIDDATQNLRKENDRDESVHEARKSLKKIRGALRLVEPELGRTYRAENARFRGIARKLSEIRDAAAMIEVFDSLLGKYDGDLQKNALSSIRGGLEQNKQETEQAAGVATIVQRALATLTATRNRVQDWPLKTDGFAAIAPGLKERYRRGRAAMARARKDPTPENYHEWRKRVKDHWYHVRLLESSWTDVLQARESSLKDLETWLGDDHNLTVLCQKIAGKPEQFGEQKHVQLFLALAAQHQKELRANSLSLGERIYEEKPRVFVDRISGLWDGWQKQPDSMKEPEAEKRAVKKQAASAPSATRKKTAAA